jgi:hypothetical protein
VTREASVGQFKGHLWAHEFGHSAGLGEALNQTNRIMSIPLATGNNAVTRTECRDNFKNNNIDWNGPGGSSLIAEGSSFSGTPLALDLEPNTYYAPNYAPLPIEALARTPIIDSVPMEAADYYSQEDVARLRAMLADPSEAEHYPTITTLIGIISEGADADARALIEFARDDSHEPSALSGAVLALGYIASTGNQLALSYLAEQSDRTESPKATWAVQGLGLSGRAEAIGILQKLRAQADPPGARQSRFARASDLLDESLGTASSVQAKGLRRLYAESRL